MISPKPNSGEINRVLRLLINQGQLSDGRVNIYTLTPNEFRDLLRKHGFDKIKIIGKNFIMPTFISSEFYLKREYSRELLDKLLSLEFFLCEREDALGLAMFLHAIAYKR